MSGCVPPEEYVRLMKEVGFEDARWVGTGVFWTSPTTRSMDFVGVKSAAVPVARRAKPSGAQRLVAFGVVALAAVALARVWMNKRS